MADTAVTTATTVTAIAEVADSTVVKSSASGCEAPVLAQPPRQAAADNGPVPLSFPAILRNPGLPTRFAHLRAGETVQSAPAAALPRKKQREDHEGKRWIRRRENARFVHNPHIVHATKSDYALPPPSARSTFPVPLPPYLARSASAPSAVPVSSDAASANAGQFSLSLKGMRRELRRAGARAVPLVCDVENELVRWLRGGTFFAPDAPGAHALKFPGEPVAGREAIREVLRTPWQLVWAVEGENAGGGFARYVVHCCARYYNAVSFSKDVEGTRLTYILRPDASRTGGPNAGVRTVLDTPPTTDISSAAETSESELDIHSDAYSAHGGGGGGLSDIAESQSDASPSRGASPARGPPLERRPLSPAEWSVIEEEDVASALDWDSGIDDDGDADPNVDGDADADGEGEDLVQSIASLSVISDASADASEADRTPRPLRYFRARTWDGSRRATSGSSPSRSPMRRGRRRASGQQQKGAKERVGKGKKVKMGGDVSFYDYLFG